MLFGNSPMKPKGLFGMFAQGDTQIPMPQGPDLLQQVRANMPQSEAPKKPGFFAEGGLGRMIAGGLGDVLAQQSGGQPVYMQNMLQQRALKQRQQMMQQQRESDWQDFQRQEQWKLDHQKPVNNDTVNDFNWYKGLSAEDRALYDQFHPVTMMGPTGPIAVPRPSLGGISSGPQPGAIEDGYRFKGGNPADPNAWEPVGGGVGNGTGGFPVTGSKLDNVTARNESGARDFYSNGSAVVSPKGARFAMQVLPSTARDPGFGIRPANPNDPEDMNRLGREYRAKMESRYKGNLPLMWAAYNAGPGRIDSLLAKYGQNWLQYAPRETQNYVARNMRAVRGN